MSTNIIILDNSPSSYKLAAAFIESMNEELALPVPKEWLDKIISRAIILANLDSNESSISGFFAMYCNDKVNGVAYVAGLHVLKQYRGYGISKLLLSKAIDLCKSNLMKKLTLYCKCDNLLALNLYKRYGFVIVRKERKPEYRDEEHFFMELNL